MAFDIKSYLQGVEGLVTALQAGIDGVYRQHERPDFIVAMNNYGSTVGDKCYGCLAACAVQQVYASDRTRHESYVKHSTRLAGGSLEERKTLDRFEAAMDSVRYCSIDGLLAFCGVVDYYDRIRISALAHKHKWLIDINWTEVNDWERIERELKKLQRFVNAVMRAYSLEWEITYVDLQ